jgi:DNA-binding transcriptional LysR family regulator
MNVGTAFGTYALVPALPEFLARYPEIELELALTDRIVDLADVGADLAIRVGPLGDVNLVAHKLCDLTRRVRRTGLPRAPWHAAHAGRSRPAQLPDDHGIPGQREWPFETVDGVRDVAVHSSITVNNAGRSTSSRYRASASSASPT